MTVKKTEKKRDTKFDGKPGPGRPKGVPNKVTVAVKDAIQNAFTKVGGEDYLVKVAEEDPKTFCTLLGKVIPVQVGGDPDNPIVGRIEWRIVDADPKS